MTTSDARARMALGIAEMERQRVAALVEIVQEQLRAERDRADRLKKILEEVAPLVLAARNWVHSGGDKDALEALVVASDTLEWSVLNALGIVEDDED